MSRRNGRRRGRNGTNNDDNNGTPKRPMTRREVRFLQKSKTQSEVAKELYPKDFMKDINDLKSIWNTLNKKDKKSQKEINLVHSSIQLFNDIKTYNDNNIVYHESHFPDELMNKKDKIIRKNIMDNRHKPNNNNLSIVSNMDDIAKDEIKQKILEYKNNNNDIINDDNNENNELKVADIDVNIDIDMESSESSINEVINDDDEDGQEDEDAIDTHYS